MCCSDAFNLFFEWLGEYAKEIGESKFFSLTG